MLSLFGYDAKGDYYRITQEMVGRRVNLAAPEQSLMLLKAIGKVPHTGGELFKPETKYYKKLLAWIEAGAPDDTDAVPQPVEITLSPDRIVFETGGQICVILVFCRMLWPTYNDRMVYMLIKF